MIGNSCHNIKRPIKSQSDLELKVKIMSLNGGGYLLFMKKSPIISKVSYIN